MKKLLIAILAVAGNQAYAQSSWTIKTTDDKSYSFPIEKVKEVTFTNEEEWQPEVVEKEVVKEVPTLPKDFAKQIEWLKTAATFSPYISKVIDVDLAPGQFINTLPNNLGTKETAIASVANSIVGKVSSMVHLGGWGGSVTVGFDHPIQNFDGCDFRGHGNAFVGSSEPGIYYVAQADENGNPKKWYLIKHGMYDYSIHDYEITYYKPEKEYAEGKKITYLQANGKTASVNVVKDELSSVLVTKDDKTYYVKNGNEYEVTIIEDTKIASFAQYIKWTDNLGHSGYEPKNSFHQQSYWPEYAGDKIVIKGEYLPVGTQVSKPDGVSNYYVNDPKAWGFPLAEGKNYGTGAYGMCDTYTNDNDLSCIDIDWAVDEDGNPANLDHIDFVKVQTAIHYQAGMLGENSCEFRGIEDLHLTGKFIKVDTSIKPTVPENGYWYWSY